MYFYLNEKKYIQDLNLKWIIIGLTAGAAGAAIILLNKKEFSFQDTQSFLDNEMLDNVNDYLLKARKKAGEIIKNAEEQSSLMIGEAGKNLLYVKEKTEELHKKISEGSIEEAMKIKDELENIITEFKNKIK